MSVVFTPNQTIGQGDLDIFLTNATGAAANAYSITYAIYYVDPGPPETEVLIGSPTRTPVNPTVGEYYASLTVPGTATPGDYRIRWTFQQFAGSPPQQVVMEWAVVATGTVTSLPTYSGLTQGMINKLRLLLRDQNPDKYYHFRPPEAEGNIGNYNRVFGQIWEDAELYEYLERGLDWWNMMPPNTAGLRTIDQLVTEKPEWRTAVLWDAITHACFALACNWVADEFDYSIGGVSLSIEKSSKYESLKQNAEGQFDKAAEAKARTVKFIRGIQQPKYGIGIRSSFGPFVGRGVLSPRNFL
jgi:hypothetical protein